MLVLKTKNMQTQRFANMNINLYFIILSIVVLTAEARKKTNIILIIADDVGAGDFYHTGHPTQERNEIDDMAEEGIRFTHYTAIERACTPNRAALLTGRYPVRFGLHGRFLVHIPMIPGGLPRSEITIAEALQDLGYKTGLIGKWHLGINEKNNTDGFNLPHNHGFDYVGLNLPMTHWQACRPELPLSMQTPYCFLYNGSSIIEQPYNAKTLSTRLLDDAKNFINKNAMNPFFLYMSLPQPHANAFCGKKFCGKSKRGIVGDGINEMAWIVGQLIKTVDRNKIHKDTLIIFMNDHGPSNLGCQESLSTGAFRENGGTLWEGGLRGPFIARWKGRIGKGTISHSIIAPIDLFPTFLRIAGDSNYLRDRNITIDGKMITEIAAIKQNPPENRILLHHCDTEIFAVRYNQYKLHYHTISLAKHLQTPIPINENKHCSMKKEDIPWVMGQWSCKGTNAAKHDPPLLFDVDKDPGETKPLDLKKYEKIVQIIHNRVRKFKDSYILKERGVFDVVMNPDLTPCCDPPKCTCNYFPDK